jgi:hypothetical protein
MRKLALALLCGLAPALLIGSGCPKSPSAPPLAKCAAAFQGLAVPTFHGGNARIGWNAAETSLTPAAVASTSFGLAWSSPLFDTVTLNGQTYTGRMYASPLYADDLTIQGGPFGGQAFDVVFAAATNGFVYAVDAFAAGCSVPAGAVLWKTQLAAPVLVPELDGALPLGVLSTPVLDTAALRLYVAAMDGASGTPVWSLFALDATSGAPIAGFPVALDAAAVEPVNQNGPCSLEPNALEISQRSALALSPAGDRVYVTFAGYADQVAGWIVAVDTATASVASSFSIGANSPLGQANGGMWGAGGPAIDDDGTVLMTTGNGPASFGPQGVPATWGDSLLAWTPDLALNGTYSPWNYCLSDSGDADVGGSSPLLLPDLSTTATSVPPLVAFGSKQGNVYLLDRSPLPGGLTARSPCNLDAGWQSAATDQSLLPAAGPPYCDPQAPANCVAGPLNVFGPYSDVDGMNENNSAKMKSTPAFFTNATGESYLYVTGTTLGADDGGSVPPSVVRLRVSFGAGQPTSLAVDAATTDSVMLNPGSPVGSSQGTAGAIVWVVDENAPRKQPLTDPAIPHPVLYAIDATTLQTLYRSGATDLDVGGKYVTPVVAHGTVFVGTDRIQAFSLQP